MTATAPFAIHPLDFDSRLLELACGRIDLDDHAGDIQESAAETIIALLHDHPEYDLVHIKAPGQSPELAGRLIRHGARLMDTELTFVHGPAHMDHTDDAIIRTDRWPASDFLPLAEAMIYSRFQADPQIPQEKAICLWRESIRNHCQGRAQALAVALADGRPAGMATLVPASPDGINLFIVGVLPCFQGQGIGQRLVRAAAGFYPEKRIQVEASGRNRRAVHCYQQAGFRLDHFHYVLHFWNNTG